ncbi:hypothetical protein Trydic_g13119 [Trypoxylus dichotomus]
MKYEYTLTEVESGHVKMESLCDRLKYVIVTGYEDKLVSFDVTSLFTNVPIEAALAIVKNRLSRDTTLDEIKLSVKAITELLSTCVTKYFQVDNEFYQ